MLWKSGPLDHIFPGFGPSQIRQKHTHLLRLGSQNELMQGASLCATVWRCQRWRLSSKRLVCHRSSATSCLSLQISVHFMFVCFPSICLYWWASQNRRCPRAQATIFTAFLRKYFFKKMLFLDNFWLLKPPKTKKGGYPPPPFHILNFKIFTKSKTWQFLGLETRPGRHFLMVFTMFFAPP